MLAVRARERSACTLQKPVFNLAGDGDDVEAEDNAVEPHLMFVRYAQMPI